MKTDQERLIQLRILAIFVLVTLAGIFVAPILLADEEHGARPFKSSDLRGTWTMSGWVEATLLIPFPAEITHTSGPGDLVNPGDKVALSGTLVGLFEFNGYGGIETFNDVFKPGRIEPLSPPFPIPWVPPLPESGHGSYTVNANGIVMLVTEIIDPASGSLAGEVEYSCVLNRKPERMDCVFARFKTYVVDPNGFDAPITGQVTFMPQR